MAEMVAAQIFNERNNQEINTIFGVVTNGNQWKFIKLNHDLIYLDLSDYYIINPAKIMGILMNIVKPESTTSILNNSSEHPPHGAECDRV